MSTTTTQYTLPPNSTYHQHQPFPVENWIIIGTGPTVEEDWAQLLRYPCSFLARSEFVLVNRAKMPDAASRADHHVTYHPEFFHITGTGGVRDIPRRHANIAMPFTTDCWLIPDEYHIGGSAFFAAYIAKQLGVKRAVLVGCPMVGGSEHTELVTQFHEAPRHVQDYYRSILTSLSGTTRRIFGAPNTLHAHTHCHKEDF